MKVLIGESQKDKLIGNILEKNGVEIDYGYGSRIKETSGKVFDSVEVTVRYRDWSKTQYKQIWFETNGNDVGKVDGFNNFIGIANEFEFIPKELVMEYFIGNAKNYLERILPLINLKDKR